MKTKLLFLLVCCGSCLNGMHHPSSDNLIVEKTSTTQSTIIPSNFGALGWECLKVVSSEQMELPAFKAWWKHPVFCGSSEECVKREFGPMNPKFLYRPWRKGRTWLHFAAALDVRFLGALLKKGGANPNVLDKKGKTPLYSAAEEGEAEAIEVLVESGAELNPGSKSSDTPLYLAILLKHVGAVQELLKRGALIGLDEVVSLNGQNRITPEIKDLLSKYPILVNGGKVFESIMRPNSFRLKISTEGSSEDEASTSEPRSELNDPLPELKPLIPKTLAVLAGLAQQKKYKGYRSQENFRKSRRSRTKIKYPIHKKITATGELKKEEGRR